MNKLKSNFIFNSTYQIISLIIPIIITPYISRVLLPEGIGIYSYTFSIVSYFMMIALLGTNTYGNREISKVKDNSELLNKKFSSIFFLQLITSTISIVFYILFLLILKPDNFTIMLLQIINLISVVFDINWLFCGLQQFKFTVSRSAVIKVLTFISIFTFVKTKDDVWIYTLIMASSTIVNQLILWPFLCRNKVHLKKVSKKEILSNLKPTLILFIPVIATSIYNVMDKIMIGLFCDTKEVGFYENAEKMLNIMNTVVASLGTVTLPEITYLYHKGEYEKAKIIFQKSMKFIYFLAIPIIFGLLAVSNKFIVIYMGNEFEKTSILLKILVSSLLFTPFSSMIRMQILIPKSKDKEYIIATISGAVVNLILNLIMIPLINSIGACISTIISHIVVLIMQYCFSKKDIVLKKIVRDIGRFFITSVIMFVAIIMIDKVNIENQIVALAIEISIGIIIYGLLNIKFIINSVFKRNKNEK